VNHCARELPHFDIFFVEDDIPQNSKQGGLEYPSCSDAAMQGIHFWMHRFILSFS